VKLIGIALFWARFLEDPLVQASEIEALQQRPRTRESSARVSEREVKSIPVLAVLSVMVDNDVLEMMLRGQFSRTKSKAISPKRMRTGRS
jgi:hypothetical protein